MSFKKWLSIFLASFFIVIGGTCLVNFIFNPDGFFRPKYWSEPVFSPVDGRNSKPSYIATNAEKFSCVIIGGSNAGFLRTKTVQELTGQACFNSYVTSGFFCDYLCLVDFYAKTMPNLNEIILNISNNEIEFEKDTKKNPHTAMPIYLCKKFELHPFLKSLMKIPSVKYFLKETPQRHELDNTEFGEHDDVYDGNDEEQMQKMVLQDGAFHWRITNLCTSEKRNFPYLKQSLIELQEIKNICDFYGIKLTVMMGAVFISKKEWFESNEFYDWLREISKITEFYDFSGFNEINLNPYNFFDADHFNKKVGDKMLRIIYGAEEIQNFGEKITSENIESYLERRRADYEKVKDEFRRTGTIKLFDKSHQSYVE